MPASPPSYKYFAFISYSRKDSKAAAWLQKRLEWFRFPVKLVPEDRRPPHDRYVRPIYRDKTNLEVTDEHYWTNIRRALEESRHLIILCSEHSAKSQPVNMEVEHFLATHANDPSLLAPVIVSGNVTSEGEDAALCPVLRAVRDHDGKPLIDRNLPTMVPDTTTSEQDAWEAGFVSLASYLLQLERTAIGDHIQRETKRQANVLRRWLLLVAALMIIALAAMFVAENARAEAASNEKAAIAARELSEKQKRESDGLVALMSLAERDVVKALNAADAPDLARNLTDRLALYLYSYGVPTDLRASDTADLQQLVDKAATLHTQGQSAPAIALAARILNELSPTDRTSDFERIASRARIVLGKALQDGGLMVDKDGNEIRKSMFWQEALSAFSLARKSLEEVVAADPADTEMAGLLAESITRMGDVHHMSGALDEALKYYREALKFCEEHSEGRLGDKSWQMRLAESHLHIGHITGCYLDNKAMVADAKAHFEACHAIVKPLLEVDAKDIPALTLEVGVEGAMAVLITEDDPSAAINYASQAADNLRMLASLQPESAPAKRELSVGLWRLADLLMKQKLLDRKRASAAIEEGLSVLSQMEKTHPLIPFELKMRRWLEQQSTTLRGAGQQ